VRVNRREKRWNKGKGNMEKGKREMDRKCQLL
jgi:hypothetical protein